MSKRLLCGVLMLLSQAALAVEVVKSGTWTTIDYDVEGMWRIVDTGDGLAVELGEDFETKNGPDLHILLSPMSVGALSNENASSKALIVGLLQTTDGSFFKKMKGPQTLPLPSGTTLSDYKSIVIHCVKFSHLWAGAPLD